MNWIKANWLIVVLSVVALAALPSMFFVSNNLSKTLSDKTTKDVQTAYKEVTSENVTYSIPSVQQPDAKAFEKSTAVNPNLTKRYADARDAIKRESSLIGAEAVKFNQGTRRPLVDDLFPAPSPASRFKTPPQFATAVIQSYPTTLLDRVNAKPPRDAASMGADLSEYHRQRVDRLRSTQGNIISADEVRKLNEELLDQRLGRYRQHAFDTAFYADDTVFYDLDPTVPNPIPPLSELWDWQMKVWIYDDLFESFALANKMAAGGETGNVLSGVVKRVVRIQIDGRDYQNVPDDQPADQSGEALAAPAKDPVTPDMSKSVSGRYSGAQTGNQYYDLRKATIEMVVAPEKLPLLFDALSQTNFMTVLRCDLETIEADTHLREGYYYGDDHVAKAIIVVESIWLRAWTKQYMPMTVRRAVGVPEDKPAEATEEPPQ